jgi:hypothetical protein
MKKNAALNDLLDLGLMTRILCHEINNLLASQQGFLKLIGRGSSDPKALERWNDEVLQANFGLQDLIRSMQSLVHSHPLEEQPSNQALEDKVMRLADSISIQGAKISSLALTRLLLITAELLDLQDQEPNTWLLTIKKGPINKGLLEFAQHPISFLSLCIPLIWHHPIHDELNTAANRILPPRNSSIRDWRWALVIGLLRQSQGDITLTIQSDSAGDQTSVLELLLPIQDPFIP